MTASRGRSKFARWRWLLAAMTALFRLLPRRASRFVYGCVMGWPGLLGVATRYAIAARLARGLGESVMIGTEVEILGWEGLEIGSHVSINRGCYLDATGGLRIGDNVSIAHACSIMTTEHTWENELLPIRENPLRPDPVRIEDDVWLGCGVRLLAGATVHSRAVIAAGAVVTKDVPARTIVGGVPARTIREL